MDEDRVTQVSDIKDEILQGHYRVDPTAVADAILRRLRELALTSASGSATAAQQYQNECS